MADSDGDQSSSSAPVPHDLLAHRDLGLPQDFNPDGQLHLRDETATLCGMKLNPEGIHSGVKNTVIGGVICVGNKVYAMTSARSHVNTSQSYHVERESRRDLDWCLCYLLAPLEVPNVNGSTRLIRYTEEADLVRITGTVKVLAGRGKEFEARLSVGEGWVPQEIFRYVNFVGLITTLPNETVLPRGAWVVKDDSLCGYVVHCEPGYHGSRVGFMVPIERAFEEMKKILKGEPLFPYTTSWEV